MSVTESEYSNPPPDTKITTMIDTTAKVKKRGRPRNSMATCPECNQEISAGSRALRKHKMAWREKADSKDKSHQKLDAG